MLNAFGDTVIGSTCLFHFQFHFWYADYESLLCFCHFLTLQLFPSMRPLRWFHSWYSNGLQCFFVLQTCALVTGLQWTWHTELNVGCIPSSLLITKTYPCKNSFLFLFLKNALCFFALSAQIDEVLCTWFLSKNAMN